MFARQPWVSHDGAEASTAREIEGHGLVPSDAVENPVGTKAQTAGSAELGRSTGWEHTNELAVRCAVLTNAGYRPCRRAEHRILPNRPPDWLLVAG